MGKKKSTFCPFWPKLWGFKVQRTKKCCNHWDLGINWLHKSKLKKKGYLVYFNQVACNILEKDLPGKRWADPTKMSKQDAWLYEGRLNTRSLILGTFEKDSWMKKLRTASQWKINDYSRYHPEGTPRSSCLNLYSGKVSLRSNHGAAMAPTLLKTQTQAGRNLSLLVKRNSIKLIRVAA